MLYSIKRPEKARKDIKVGLITYLGLSKSPLATPALRSHGTTKTVPPFPSSLFNAPPFPRIFPNLRPSPFCPALGSFFHPSIPLSSSSVLLLKWENDGRTMGELRTKKRKKSSRIHIGHRDRKAE